MFFSGNNNTTGIMQAAKIDNVLNEISRAITKATSQGKHPVFRPQMQTYDVSEQETELLNMMQQEDTPDPSPIYTNCWLSQTDSTYVDQDESNIIFTERSRRRSGPKPAGGAKEYLRHWMSPDDLKKAVKEHFADGLNERSRFADGINERSLCDVPYSMGPAESPLSKIGIGMTDFHYIDPSNLSKRRMERAIKTNWERQVS